MRVVPANFQCQPWPEGVSAVDLSGADLNGRQEASGHAHEDGPERGGHDRTSMAPTGKSANLVGHREFFLFGHTPKRSRRSTRNGPPDALAGERPIAREAIDLTARALQRRYGDLFIRCWPTSAAVILRCGDYRVRLRRAQNTVDEPWVRSESWSKMSLLNCARCGSSAADADQRVTPSGIWKCLQCPSQTCALIPRQRTKPEMLNHRTGASMPRRGLAGSNRCCRRGPAWAACISLTLGGEPTYVPLSRQAPNATVAAMADQTHYARAWPGAASQAGLQHLDVLPGQALRRQVIRAGVRLITGPTATSWCMARMPIPPSPARDDEEAQKAQTRPAKQRGLLEAIAVRP